MSEPIAPGRLLGARYRLVRPIARGGMASVWEGEDPLLSRRVAVKLLDPTLATDDALRARFRREAIAAARLSHPNIVATYDTGEDDGVAFIVMELVDGVTLRELLDAQGALSVGEATDLAMQVAAALTHAHENGLVHRDVKPGNVLVQPDGHVKVTDFGIAKAADAGGELTRAGSVMGTARYVAPEQLRDGPVDARADVYSLALVLYELLCGRSPFAGESDVATAVARLTAEPPLVTEIQPDVPDGLAGAIAAALVRDPAERTPSAAALRAAIAPYRGRAGSVPDATRPVEIPHPIPAVVTNEPEPLSLAARVLGAVALFAIGVAIGYFGWRALDGASSRSTTTSTTLAAAPLPIAEVTDFDPLGDDRQENSAQAGNAADGGAATSWSTVGYATADLGGKAGVGLQIQLETSAEIGAVRVATDAGGWNAEVYVADEPFTAAPSGDAVAVGADLPAQAKLELAPPTRGQYVLLWITRLPRTGSGANPFRLLVIEAQVLD